ncbi:MAG TPA: EAL domain-containing protein [Candidatus Dormibacteraeota bacterium]|nr:EAL domain-containing protein [Candidatus Dormibacteraeota bacterium]
MNSILAGGRDWLDRLSSATGRAMGPRNTILDRVRFLFMAFLVFNAAFGAFILLRTHKQDLTQLIASYSLTYLVFYAVWGYLKRKLPLWMDLIAALALVGVGLQVTDLVRLYLLFYGVLLFRCLFGSGWGVVTITTLFLSSLVGSVAVTSFSVSQPALAAQVLVNIPGFAAGAWLIHQVKRTLIDYTEALRRERVLTESADDLVAAENPEAVYDAGIRGAMGLIEQVKGGRAALAVGTLRTQRQVAAGPPPRLVDVPEVKVATLPEHLQEAVAEMRPVSAKVIDETLLAGRGDEGLASPFTGWATGVPLTIEGKLRGVISVAGTEQLPVGVGDGLSRLGSSVALALERVNLAEDLRRSTDSLKSSEARFRSLVQNSSDVITLLDEQGRISYVSPAVEKLLGYETGKLLNGTLWRLVHPDDLNTANTTFQELLRTDYGQELLGTRWRHADGTYRYMETILSNQLADPHVRAVVLNTRDVTERKDLEDKLRHQAHHDPLSGLSNRTLFKERVAASLARHRSDRGSLAVLFLDLDDFKHVNDSLGHAAGDSLLLAVAGRLQECVGPSDTVARFGGDEFAILLDTIPDDAYPITIAERILGAFRLPLQVGTIEMIAAFSIGIAISTARAQDPEEFLRNADVAMYRAKGRGKRTYEVFEISMHAAAIERLEMENDLRQAIARNELFVEYQPIVQIDTEEVYGVEALVRWRHPTKGLVGPDRFIPLAEETGMIAGIGSWVLETACREVVEWDGAFPDRRLRLGVNLSMRQAQRRNIVNEIRQVLKRTGFSSERLTMEVTESAVIREGEDVAAVLQRLRSAGVKVAIDDFGTGYSSLSYLARFPIDVIKIDKAFVKASSRGAKSSALLRAIVGLGHSLGVEIVAEGIETRQQARILEPLGCRGQGYFYSRSIDSEAVMAILGSGGHLRGGGVRKSTGGGDKSVVLELLEGGQGKG